MKKKEAMTMLIVTHKMGFAKEVGDRIIFMDNGYIIEQGNPKSLFINPQYARTKKFLRQVVEK